MAVDLVSYSVYEERQGNNKRGQRVRDEDGG